MNIALILAGGSGTRAGGPLPKQFQTVGGKPMFRWSVEAFRSFDPDCRIILVVHPDFLARWKELFPAEAEENDSGILMVPGGKTRIGSVRNGLAAIEASGDDVVFIHDAARPFVSADLIRRGAGKARAGVGAVPGVPVVDSLRLRDVDGGSTAVDRARFVAVQTPQIFLLDDIRCAYDGCGDDPSLTDDASVAERAGIGIALYDGDPDNVKITNPSDFRFFSK